ncbi:hypothetical protein HW555_009592 [Spodoptera exigua]|uniref:Uncharacterized protein n=1 Tax=Spodoptera exigua TaxID=7107 RepID=A0A835L6M0_SPOEX|nr:hypothetical protein HW555_009592 [Spodoptera exigua]
MKYQFNGSLSYLGRLGFGYKCERSDFFTFYRQTEEESSQNVLPQQELQICEAGELRWISPCCRFAREKIAQVVKFAPDQKLVQDGDSYTYITNGPDGVKEIKFKSGVEFDDVIGADKIPIKTKYTVDGNVVTQNISAPQGTAVFKREYNGDELVVVITGDKFDGVAKRYYKAE